MKPIRTDHLWLRITFTVIVIAGLWLIWRPEPEPKNVHIGASSLTATTTGTYFDNIKVGPITLWQPGDSCSLRISVYRNGKTYRADIAREDCRTILAIVQKVFPSVYPTDDPKNTLFSDLSVTPAISTHQPIEYSD